MRGIFFAQKNFYPKPLSFAIQMYGKWGVFFCSKKYYPRPWSFAFFMHGKWGGVIFKKFCPRPLIFAIQKHGKWEDKTSVNLLIHVATELKYHERNL